MMSRFSTGSIDWAFKRQELVRELYLEGMRKPSILAALEKVPRHEFVPAPYNLLAYADIPLPIGHEQTISQPAVVAGMIEMAGLKRNHKVLEVGTGCGYNAAVMSLLADKVYTTEIIPELHETAKKTLARLGYNNVESFLSDGGYGLPDQAPFDVIVVTASAPSIPPALKEQLAVGGRLIIPVKEITDDHDNLEVVERTSETEYSVDKKAAVRFVPLKGTSTTSEASEKGDKGGLKLTPPSTAAATKGAGDDDGGLSTTMLLSPTDKDKELSGSDSSDTSSPASSSTSSGSSKEQQQPEVTSPMAVTPQAEEGRKVVASMNSSQR